MRELNVSRDPFRTFNRADRANLAATCPQEAPFKSFGVFTRSCPQHAFPFRRLLKTVSYFICAAPLFVTLFGRSFSKNTWQLSREIVELANQLDAKEYDCTRLLPMYDAILVSYGGSGSTAGFTWLKKYFEVRNLNFANDSDGLKHLHYTELAYRLEMCRSRVGVLIYQFADPVEAVFSLYRRNYTCGQFQKLRSSISRDQCVSQLSSVEHYASTGVDMFGFWPHLGSYIRVGKNLDLPVIFVNSKTREQPEALLAMQRAFIATKSEIRLNYELFQRIAKNEVHGNTGEDNCRRRGKYSNSSYFAELGITYELLTQLQHKLGQVSISHNGRFSVLRAHSTKQPERHCDVSRLTKE